MQFQSLCGSNDVIDFLQSAATFVVTGLKFSQKIAPSKKLSVALNLIPNIQVLFGIEIESLYFCKIFHCKLI